LTISKKGRKKKSKNKEKKIRKRKEEQPEAYERENKNKQRSKKKTDNCDPFRQVRVAKMICSRTTTKGICWSNKNNECFLELYRKLGV